MSGLEDEAGVAGVDLWGLLSAWGFLGECAGVRSPGLGAGAAVPAAFEQFKAPSFSAETGWRRAVVSPKSAVAHLSGLTDHRWAAAVLNGGGRRELLPRSARST